MIPCRAAGSPGAAGKLGMGREMRRADRGVGGNRRCASNPGSSIRGRTDNLLVASMKDDGERGSRGGELGRVEASSAPGGCGRIGPALGDPAQAVAGPDGGSVPGHGGLRPGLPPRRDRGGPDRLRGVRGALGAGRAARRRRHLPPVAPVVRAASDRAGVRGGQAGVLCAAAGRRPVRARGARASWSRPAGSSSCPSSPGGAIRRRSGSRSCWRPSWARRGWSSAIRGSTGSTATPCPARPPRSRRRRC